MHTKICTDIKYRRELNGEKKKNRVIDEKKKPEPMLKEKWFFFLFYFFFSSVLNKYAARIAVDMCCVHFFSLHSQRLASCIVFSYIAITYNT